LLPSIIKRMVVSCANDYLQFITPIVVS
jgi:hypothetical protein